MLCHSSAGLTPPFSFHSQLQRRAAASSRTPSRQLEYIVRAARVCTAHPRLALRYRIIITMIIMMMVMMMM